MLSSAQDLAHSGLQGHDFSLSREAFRVSSHIGPANKRFIHRRMERYDSRVPRRDAPLTLLLRLLYGL
jgi:hypothetical protein